MVSRPPDSMNAARMRLRSIAGREPLVLRLLEPGNRPLILAFTTGLAVGGFKPARRWLKRQLFRQIGIHTR